MKRISWIVAFSVWAVINSFIFANKNDHFYTGNGELPGHMTLDEVHFLGAHNSAISKENNWRYFQQNVGLRKQWEQYGVRAFKVPLHYFNPSNTSRGKIKNFFSKNNESEVYVALAHEPDGYSNCQLTLWQRNMNSFPEKAESYFRELADLLEKNPHEIAIVMIESYLARRSEKNGMAQDPRSQRDMIHEMLNKSGVSKYIFSLKDNGYDEYSWPTIDKLRSKNQRLIVITDSYEDDLDFVSLYRENTFTLTVEGLQSDKFEDLRHDWKRSHDFNAKFFVLNHFLELSRDKSQLLGAPVNASIELFSKGKLQAVDYNDFNSYTFIMHHIQKMKKAVGITPNILLIDFVDKGKNDGVQFDLENKNFFEGPQRVIFELNAEAAFKYLEENTIE